MSEQGSAPAAGQPPASPTEPPPHTQTDPQPPPHTQTDPQPPPHAQADPHPQATPHIQADPHPQATPHTQADPSGIWSRFATRSRAILAEGLRGLASPLAPAFHDELEELLVSADLGPVLAAKIADGVRNRRPVSLDDARAALESEVIRHLCPKPRWLNLNLEHGPACVLFYGINGAGKTTTVGKLAHGLRRDGRKVLVVAADTYRAAGIEQAVAWAERAGVEHFAGRPGGDPAAAVFDGLKLAEARNFDVVLVDTAGRLQTQQNLVAELAKVGRVAARALEGAPHESLLVLDGVLGQANLAQARGFNEAVKVSGLVLTKMEGTAKGGALVAIESALDVPTKMVGLGEGLDDLYAFDPRQFAAALFGRGH